LSKATLEVNAEVSISLLDEVASVFVLSGGTASVSYISPLAPALLYLNISSALTVGFFSFAFSTVSRYRCIKLFSVLASDIDSCARAFSELLILIDAIDSAVVGFLVPGSTYKRTVVHE
jgi:hypothetical protein